MFGLTMTMFKAAQKELWLEIRPRLIFFMGYWVGALLGFGATEDDPVWYWVRSFLLFLLMMFLVWLFLTVIFCRYQLQDHHKANQPT